MTMMVVSIQALLLVLSLLLCFITIISARSEEDPLVYVNEVDFNKKQLGIEFVCRDGSDVGKLKYQLYRVSDGRRLKKGNLNELCAKEASKSETSYLGKNPESSRGTGFKTIEAKNKNNDDGISVCIHSTKLGVTQFVAFGSTDGSTPAKGGKCDGMVPSQAGQHIEELTKKLQKVGTIRLVGTGCSYNDFGWVVDKKGNMGIVPNEDQGFVCVMDDPPVYVNEVDFDNEKEVSVEFVCRDGFDVGKVKYHLYSTDDGKRFEEGELNNVCQNSPDLPRGTGSMSIKAKTKKDDGISVCIYSNKLGLIQFVGFAEDVSTPVEGGKCDGMVPDATGQQLEEEGSKSKTEQKGRAAVRLVGKGCSYGDFEWVVDKQANIGTVPNKDQLFICVTDPPTGAPSQASMIPTVVPSVYPTFPPTALPSDVPSVFPTAFPTLFPSTFPSPFATLFPSTLPSPSVVPIVDPPVYVNEVDFDQEQVSVEFICIHGFDVGKVKYQLYSTGDGKRLEDGELNQVCETNPKSPKGTGSMSIKAKDNNNYDGISVCIHSKNLGVIQFVGFATDVSKQAKGGKCDGMVPDEAGKQPAKKDLSKKIQKGGAAVRLVGKGCSYGDFEWVVDKEANVGTVPNNDQVFICITDPPTVAPSQFPSANPSPFPTLFPSIFPSQHPSTTPSVVPSVLPTFSPSALPTVVPSQTPSELPSGFPTTSPSQYPSTIPTREPSTSPSAMPSNSPSLLPSPLPSNAPSLAPSHLPSYRPSSAPSDSTCRRCKEIMEESNPNPNSEGIEIGIEIEDDHSEGIGIEIEIDDGNSEGIGIGFQIEDDNEDVVVVGTNKASNGHSVDQRELEGDGVVTMKVPGITGDNDDCVKKCYKLLSADMDEEINEVGCERLCRTMIKEKKKPSRTCKIHDLCD